VEFKNAGPLLCLAGVPGQYRKWDLNTQPCDKGENQKWSVLGSDPLKTIRHKASGFCLTSDMRGSRDAGLDECKGTDKKQKWKIEGEVLSRSLIADGGNCLEFDSKKLKFSHCDTGMGIHSRKRWEERVANW
jgi:uncharacterized membrane protein